MEAAFAYSLSDPFHESCDIEKVMERSQLKRQQFVSGKKMMQISPGKILAGKTMTSGIDRTGVGFIFPVGYMESKTVLFPASVFGMNEEAAMSGSSGRSHAVKKIHASPDRLEHIFDLTDA